MTKVQEYYKKWSENCRVFINYKPIHDHEDLLRFAEEYHQSQLKLLDIDNVRLSLQLLKLAKCPNSNCDNNGTISYQISDDEWEPQQCQWCDDKRKLLSNEA